MPDYVTISLPLMITLPYFADAFSAITFRQLFTPLMPLRSASSYAALLPRCCAFADMIYYYAA